MSKKDDKPKKSMTEALEDINELASEIQDNVTGPIVKKAQDTARAIAQREAIKNARHPHVDALTVTTSEWMRGVLVKLSEDQQHEIEFHLRRMWAITLLDNMRRNKFSWEGIRKLTGKTRQTWNNVTNSRYVPKKVLDLNINSKKRRDAMNAADYRPVTNSFIRNVVQEINRANYSVHTHAFRYAFMHGMCVWENDFLDHYGEDEFIVKQLGKNGSQFYDMSKDDMGVTCAVQGPKGDVVDLVVFPLLGIDDRMVNDHFAHEEVITVELAAYGYEDEKTRKPHQKAKTALGRWEVEEQSVVDHWSEPIPTDPNEFRNFSGPSGDQVQTPEQKPLEISPRNQLIDGSTNKEMLGDGLTIKADDGEPINKDLGGFFIFKRPLELLPQMADENGQIKLTVVVQMDEDGKTPKGVIATDNKGWFHWS